VSDVFDALQSTMGPLYVNDFNMSGRTYRVQVQADAPYRAQPDDVGRSYVRSNTSGEMIPLKALIRMSNVVGPEQVERYNGFLSAKVFGSGKPGVSSGQADRNGRAACRTDSPPGVHHRVDWPGLSGKTHRKRVAFRFRFRDRDGVPHPRGALRTLASARCGRPRRAPSQSQGLCSSCGLRGMENDIYFQIGLVVLIGLAAKNAILIVEFAQQGLLAGMRPVDAAMQAARLRFRPIVMTSLAFVLGVLPLAIASGAGAGARRSMGTGVVGGMLARRSLPRFRAAFLRVAGTTPEDGRKSGDRTCSARIPMTSRASRAAAIATAIARYTKTQCS
jgi:multidrug efflux pump subunit AcrB